MSWFVKEMAVVLVVLAAAALLGLLTGGMR
jgi:hypothetical protein